MAPPKTHWIRDPEQIAAMSSPLRMAILDRLEALGPCSVAELAESLERPADALYYHVRKLLDVGLLEEAGTRATSRRDEVIYGFPHRRWHIAYELDDPDNVAAVNDATASILRRAARDFEGGLTHPGAKVQGPERNLWSLRLEARLGREDLRELNRHLRAIVEILRKPRPARGRGTLFALSWILAPLRGPAGGRGKRAKNETKERR